MQPRAADRRRTDDRARRHRAGADSRPDPRPPAGVQLGGDHHHPRSRRRGRAGRRHHGDVRRPGVEYASASTFFATTAPVHMGIARLHAAAGLERVRAAGADPRVAAKPHQRAARVPVPSALRLRGSHRRRQPNERPASAMWAAVTSSRVISAMRTGAPSGRPRSGRSYDQTCPQRRRGHERGGPAASSTDCRSTSPFAAGCCNARSEQCRRSTV